jgi:hypothetical protein
MPDLTLTELSALSGVSLYAVYEMTQPPLRHVPSDPTGPFDPWDHFPEQEPDVSDVPSPFRAAAQAVVDEPDSAVCECCGKAAIGYVLHEDDDEPHRSGLRWRTPWLTIGPSGAVAAVCEDCAPYDAPAPEEARP